MKYKISSILQLKLISPCLGTTKTPENLMLFFNSNSEATLKRFLENAEKFQTCAIKQRILT